MLQKEVNESSSKLSIIIHSFKLNNELIQKLMKILDNESSLLNYHYTSLKYEITGKEESFETTSSNEILDYGIPKDWAEISLRFYSSDKSISIHIDKSKARIYINSNNYDWLYGKKEQIKKAFNNNELSFNKFFNSNKGWLVCAPIGLLLLLLQYSLSYSDQFKTFYTVFLLIGSFTYPLNIFWFVRWLYPKIETKHTIVTKFRKSIVGAIGVIGSIVTIFQF